MHVNLNGPIIYSFLQTGGNLRYAGASEEIPCGSLSSVCQSSVSESESLQFFFIWNNITKHTFLLVC